MTSYFIDTVILTFIIITSLVNLNAFEEKLPTRTNDHSIISEEESLILLIEPCTKDYISIGLTSTSLEKTPSSIEDIDIERFTDRS